MMRSTLQTTTADLTPTRRGLAVTPTALFRKCACGGLTCGSCQGKEQGVRGEGPGLLRRAAIAGPRSSDDAFAVAPPIVEDILSEPGRPLDGPVRSEFGPRFGRDLGAVRVHDGVKAAQSAAALDAAAYTVGEHVVFGAGRYAPETGPGRSLLAHELAHVVMHGDGIGGVGNPRTIAPADSTDERDAERVAEQVVRGIPAASTRRAEGAVLRRQLVTKDIRNLDEEALEEEHRRVANQLQRMAVVDLNYPPTYEYLQVIEAKERELKAGRPQSGPIAGPTAADRTPVAGSATTSGTDSGPISFQYTAEVIGEIPISAAGFAGVGPISGGRTAGGGDALGRDVLEGAGGALTATGQSILRFLTPLPGSVPEGAPDVYTRFAGPGAGESFFDPARFNLNRDLRPRYMQGAVTSAEWNSKSAANKFLENQMGVVSDDLKLVYNRLREVGFEGLTESERIVLQRVTHAHAQVSGPGGTSVSPLISATEHSPEALFQLADEGKIRLGVATERAYILRVKVNPGDVGKVNEILGRTQSNSGGMVNELEVVIAKDLRVAAAEGQPRILSITPNPRGPLGGAVGTGLKFVGHGLAIFGAALTIREILTAEGPHRRETEGRAFGSFAGGTVLGGLAAGFCVGFGIATGGAALLLCGLGAGLIGAAGGGFLGGRVGRLFD
jgi:Domain of unknown function (DUF4157)